VKRALALTVVLSATAHSACASTPAVRVTRVDARIWQAIEADSDFVRDGGQRLPVECDLRIEESSELFEVSFLEPAKDLNAMLRVGTESKTCGITFELDKVSLRVKRKYLNR
jgi:hypothetical protein